MKRQAFGYALTGGAASVVDIGGFHLLAPHLGGVLLPAALSFALAAAVNYLMTSRWVFRRDWRSWRQAARFFAFASVGLGFNSGATVLLALVLPATLAKAGGVAVAFSLNFLMNAMWVFRPGRPAGLRNRCAGACGPCPAGRGQTTHRAAGAAAWRPGPSATE